VTIYHASVGRVLFDKTNTLKAGGSALVRQSGGVMADGAHLEFDGDPLMSQGAHAIVFVVSRRRRACSR
jgi:hypothetical protein